MSSISESDSENEFQYHGNLNSDHGDGVNTPSVRLKRHALSELTPVNSKRTNSHNSEANGCIRLQVTPNEDKNDTNFSGLFNRSYLPIHDQEQCFWSQLYWRWRQKEGIKLDKEFYRVIHNDMVKPKSS
jgi:hypothetical protein